MRAIVCWAVPLHRGAEHGVDHCMRDHVGVAVTLQRRLVRKLDTAKHKRPREAGRRIAKPMRVVAVPHPHRQSALPPVNLGHTG